MLLLGYKPSLTIQCHLATLTRREGGTVSGCRTPNYVTVTNFHLLIANAAARSNSNVETG
jgi:hypothetical protein